MGTLRGSQKWQEKKDFSIGSSGGIKMTLRMAMTEHLECDESHFEYRERCLIGNISSRTN
jgi:hypothetical protein